MLQETVSRLMDVVDLTTPDVPTFNPGGDLRGECCIGLPVFGHLTDSDKLFNDYNEFPWWYVTGPITWKLYLEGTEVVAFVPVIRTYTQGLKTLEILRIQWLDILTAFGPGTYRVEIEVAAAVVFVSFDYKLNHYHTSRAAYTSVINYTKNSIVGGADQTFKYNYINSEFSSRIRFPHAYFRYTSAPFEKETVRYLSGYERPFKKEYRDRYQLILRSCPPELLAFAKFELLQSDTMEAVDYSPDVACGWRLVFHAVEVDGDFAPIQAGNGIRNALKLDLVNAYNNTRKLYS